MQANMELRMAAKAAGVRLWEIAGEIGITDGMFSRKLRRELPKKDRERLLCIVADIAKRKEAEANADSNQ